MGRDLALERTWRERMRQYERSGLTIRRVLRTGRTGRSPVLLVAVQN